MIPGFALTEPQRLLCRAIADAPLAVRGPAACRLYEKLGDRAAFALARENQVDSLLAHVLMEVSGSEVSAPWRQAHDETFQRLSLYLDELDRLAARLAADGIPLVALKNGGIARGIFPCPGCCPMGDLDVLVEKRHFRRAHELLLDEGYTFEFRSPLEKAWLPAAEQSGGAEYWKVLPGGEKLWLELQWRPVAGRWIRPDQEPKAEELLARSIPIPGSAVRLLAPEDNLLQIALHTAKHSYVRAPGFRLHTDVDRLVRRQALNWDLFLTRVRSLGVKTPVFFSLAIPRSLFGTPIPDKVLAQLQPHPWKLALITNWLQGVGLFNPGEPKFGRAGFVLFTALLYDDLKGLWRGLFPGKDWMRVHYRFQSSWLLPYYYGRRLM
ncbi:MAG: nucleotidyltransferase family protein, partial [Deltaproteobacteria bacterium]|nr:nucleotidyltransferase family protein [Deltaproteobacteria bacterium]